MEERLQKIIARSGISSRRHAESLILSGRIRVNGVVVRKLGTKADPDRDEILCEGRRIVPRQTSRVIMLHKPVGYLTSCRSSRERGRLVTELVPSDRRYFPVGRLDRDTSGLLLLTDDGEVTFRLSHPRHRVSKVYVVETELPLRRAQMRLMVDGFVLEDGEVRADHIEAIAPQRYRLVLSQGRKRQIRRMIEALGNSVVALHRTRIGTLELGALRPGEWRDVTTEELNALLSNQPPSKYSRRTRVPR